MVSGAFISPKSHTNRFSTLVGTEINIGPPESFEPFLPNIESTTPSMHVISNLPQIKEYEFDHQYITQHLEQLQMDPTLCSKCSPATKYFCSPEPVVQELYKKKCHWKKCPEASSTMNIKPYNTMKTPYYYIENIGMKHPPNRPRGQVEIKRVFQFL